MEKHVLRNCNVLTKLEAMGISMVQVATLLVNSVRNAVIRQMTYTITHPGQSDMADRPLAIQSDKPDAWTYGKDTISIITVCQIHNQEITKEWFIMDGFGYGFRS
jgi:hypothetical protein